MPVSEPWRLPGLDIPIAAVSIQANWLWPRVIEPSREIADHVQNAGLQIADIDHAYSGLFVRAGEAIEWVPSLAAIVARRVNAVHLIRADPGFDLSHSEPRWRDRIFVSIPDRDDEVGALRLAEGVIHEALHLHLTEFEAISPLIRDLTGTLGSPWRPEPRSYGGVLHGAFVFVGLEAYFKIITAVRSPRTGRYLDQRRAEIDEELSQLDLMALSTGLTATGDALLSRLFA